MPRKVSKQRRFEPGEVKAARRLYMIHGPRAASLIVRQMRVDGYSKFALSDLANRPERNWRGMAKEYGWEKEYAERPVAVEEPSVEPAIVPDDFPKWLEATEPNFTWGWKFQKLIYKSLGRMTRGRLKRLMVFMPPRHGKSELVTIRYAAWRLLRDPKLRIVIASYNQKLANKFSRRIKRIYEALATENTEGTEKIFTKDTNCTKTLANTLDEWETAAGGGVKAVGAGAGITGFGADLIIIDDPIKGRADAESENNRERVWDWYTDDLHTRLEPKGAVILIQTRWHEDDLAGRLLGKDKGEGIKDKEWEVVRLPALAEEIDSLGRKPGAALCPERFPREALETIREQMGSYKFDALYQQNPVPAANCLFKREWFTNVVDAAPDGLRWFRGYDLAVSTKTTADYTASFRVAFEKGTGNLFIADGMRARLEFPEQRRYIVGRIREEKNTAHGIEEALHGQAFVQELWRDEKLSKAAFKGIKAKGDKFTRALSWANRAEAGKVVLVRGPWIEEFVDEACRFPHGRHDDQIDAVSLAVHMIDSQNREVYAF